MDKKDLQANERLRCSDGRDTDRRTSTSIYLQIVCVVGCHAEQEPQEMIKYNDIDVYVTKPPDYPHSPSKLLLLLTGGTGVHSTNNQLQADKYAQEGFLVVMPDQ